MAVWYVIAALVLGAKPLSEKVSRTAFLLYILFLQLASAHHILVDPGLSAEWKVFNTSYAIYLAVLGSMIHGMSIPGAIEAAQRRNGFVNGVFEWLRRAPWDNPAFAGMFLSLTLFGFLGAVDVDLFTGVLLEPELAAAGSATERVRAVALHLDSDARGVDDRARSKERVVVAPEVARVVEHDRLTGRFRDETPLVDELAQQF